MRNKFRAELGARGISPFVSREGWLLKGLFRGIKAQARNWKRTLGRGGREWRSEARGGWVGQRANGRPNQFHTPTRRQSLFPIPLATWWFVNGRENARLLINGTHYHQGLRGIFTASPLRVNEQNRFRWHSRTAVCVLRLAARRYPRASYPHFPHSWASPRMRQRFLMRVY